MFIVVLFLFTVLVVSCVLPNYDLKPPAIEPEVLSPVVQSENKQRAPMPRPRRRKLAE